MSDKKFVDRSVYVDTFGVGHITEYFSDGSSETHTSEDYEEIYGEPDPNAGGEYYTEFMPKYGGRQPDDDD